MYKKTNMKRMLLLGNVSQHIHQKCLLTYTKLLNVDLVTLDIGRLGTN